MKKLLVLGLLLPFLYTGCGDKADDTKNAIEMMQKAPDIVKNMEQGMSESQKAREERVKRGDTLALHFSKLIEYLPKTVNGYDVQKPEGESVNMGIFSLSQAKTRYTKQGKDGSENYITVDLIDYNQAVDLYAGLIFWAAGVSIENQDGYEKTFKTDIDRVMGFEKYSIPDKTAEVTLAIGYRFLVTMRADDQKDTELLKKIAYSMDLKGLSKL
ncbi:MAG: hypothetical protein GX452_01875 [Ignavibacteriales bacterium]|jgi:hypothetical protein|nr:hypothetical protein [Ignavibacteriaceae bacterium]NLH60137.1 hypothetical protein [Ignavibacteriales bacterium]HOJ17255.1 hypothetical protein [Ignavibacteriaceae bacterium]HPO54444.1 hypothetical protein [Ignavibacteriaceae bacterium]